MSGATRLPKVRLPVPSNGDILEDTVVVELPSSNKFSITYAGEHAGLNTSGIYSQRSLNDLSEGEAEGQSMDEGDDGIGIGGEDWIRGKGISSISTTPKLRTFSSAITQQSQNAPHFSRSMSMPLPSHLTQLQHPHRPPLQQQQQPRTALSTPIIATDLTSPINSLSIELADAFQMIIQTMLQISPPQVLEAAKEQYTGCSLSIPTPSMSAMFTAMKTLNYMSANLPRFYSESESLGYVDTDAKVLNSFDIGELMQCIGDTLCGVAAHVGVDLVLHHGDMSVRHVFVKGDECGIAYTLLHIIRQILDKARPGDLIELGLDVAPHGAARSGTPSLRYEGLGERTTASPVDIELLQCTVKIDHRYSPEHIAEQEAQEEQGQEQDLEHDSNEEGSEDSKNQNGPNFKTLLLRRLLRLIDAQFTIADNVENGQTYEVSLILNKTVAPTKTPTAASTLTGVEEPYSDAEPSVEQLLKFGDTLKGRKATFYADLAGPFAQHISSYLNAWGMDITHVASDGSVERGQSLSPVPEGRFSGGNGNSSTGVSSEPSSFSSGRTTGTENQPQASFVLIDDDVGILRERLHAIRVEQYPLNLNARVRPSLAALHRPRSSHQLSRNLVQASTKTPVPVIILQFTSLANFKATKDAVQSVLSTFTNSALPLPEVMIIPKPVGPRRLLTAIHTAVTRPTIDPLFLPTATTPGTPSTHPPGTYFSPTSDTGSNNQSPQVGSSPFNRSQRPLGSRSNSDRSSKEQVLVNLPSPSPLGMPDNVEYFPDSTNKLKLGASLSSGLMLSSPDGQPAGIFFHPKSKRIPSPQPMERGVTQTGMAMGMSSQRRGSGSMPRLFSGSERDAISFASLHEVSNPFQMAVESTFNTVETPKVPINDALLTPMKRSPPDSPALEGSPPKRISARRQDLASKMKKKGKGFLDDGNVVPPISVLIVDDNRINQNILSTFMKRKKIQYGIANNGKEAVEKWKTGGFHLILMDIQMPIMDGIEATREIRKLEQQNASSGYLPVSPGSTDSLSPLLLAADSTNRPSASPYRSSVIIVALTASSLQSDRVNALAAGCNDFLTKPVSLLWLNNKIIEWGSIKALQMWADIKPETVKRLTKGQAAQARAIADRLHVPNSRKSKSPSRLSSVTTPTSILDAAMAMSSSILAAESLPTPPATSTSFDETLVGDSSSWKDVIEGWAPLPPIMPPAPIFLRKRGVNEEKEEKEEENLGSVNDDDTPDVTLAENNNSNNNNNNALVISLKKGGENGDLDEVQEGPNLDDISQNKDDIQPSQRDDGSSTIEEAEDRRMVGELPVQQANFRPR